ncbi:MAG: rhodanese-related sulfurtransferase [Rhodobacteraceae bacterium]|nr:rhodanese-related sulfurtransferase [Paracoccaceae bacterium]
MVCVAALYHFTRVPDPAVLRGPLLDVCEAGGVRGSLLLASEGINGTIAGPRPGVHAVVSHIRALAGFAGMEWKESTAREMPFGRLRVRLKREIVTMGQPQVDPTRTAGHSVVSADWNALISAPDVAVIDTRNAYEVAIGTFEGAIDPDTENFRGFPAWWHANANKFHGKRIAMFCTGGIRCEKSTAYLMLQEVKNVYHLKGGILKYLEEVPEEESLWHGECFVFDRRISVGHGLVEGSHVLCRACRRALSPEDVRRPEFELGVQCHHCRNKYTDAARTRFRERQRQVELAAARGEKHLG